ncbi:response regulator [Aquimarina aggregata]|uniref:response regulator n=1 Tax=Aquimarina aggregata TaxID=1642818 RepID=UPI00248FCFC3|nr:response regulator [Aquimarina aggregata]
MKNKLKKVLLVDDSQSTNFFNKVIIEKSDVAEEISIAKNGIEALEYLHSGNIPEIIFLDLNMPVMNGWEFLIEYQKLDKGMKGSIIIVMLGASLNKKEENFIKSIPEVKESREKMLNKEIVNDIMNTYFVESISVTPSN